MGKVIRLFEKADKSKSISDLFTSLSDNEKERAASKACFIIGHRTFEELISLMTDTEKLELERAMLRIAEGSR